MRTCFLQEEEQAAAASLEEGVQATKANGLAEKERETRKHLQRERVKKTEEGKRAG